MKQLLLIIAFLTSFMCSFGQFERVQTGDLLFVGLPLEYALVEDTSMTQAIASSTGNSKEINYIHVAILEVDVDHKIWIIDATLKHGVYRYPIDTFLNDFTLHDGSLPIFEIKRLKNNKKADYFVNNAKSFCGRDYDLYFLPDNEEKYCSELVRDAYILDGKYLFSAAPMNFKSSDGTFPIYWVQLFEYINQPIPQGVLGTNPNAMAREKCLKSVR